MTNHPVDGILLVPSNSHSKYLKVVASRSTPIVTIDRPIQVATTDSVEVENRAGARLAVEHLLEHGYKKITCVAINSHLRPVKERVAGYEECLRRARLPRKALVLSEESAETSLAGPIQFARSPRRVVHNE